jgi:glycosyltransferase involved in cell wall biosynthesis
MSMTMGWAQSEFDSATLQPELSVVVPALNEQDNVEALVAEIRRAVMEAGIVTELLIVDDGSSDATLARLGALAEQHAWLKVLHRDKPMGQSAAMFAGLQAASGKYIATLDADLQNDPADLPAMLALLKREGADMVQGDRSRNRRDHVIRRVGSVVGRRTRGLLLGDSIRDTGCSARVVKAEIAKQFPLQFRGIHRFLPAYARLLGAKVVEMPVNHRPRVAGEAKYGMGVFSRAIPGLIDCLAVRWMGRRYRDPAVTHMNGKGQ